MPHYHVRVGDAPTAWALQQGTAKAPRMGPKRPPMLSTKPPPVPKATAPNAPKAPGAKPPPVPKPPTPGSGSPGAKPASAGRRIGPVASGLRSATGVVRAGERGVNRVAEIGEEFNRDSGRDEMGHYHFNIPSRGSRMSQDYGTSEGARKRNQGGPAHYTQEAHTLQAAKHRNAATAAQAAGNQQAAQAHHQAWQAHSMAWRNPSPGNSAHAWGMSHRAGDAGVGGESWSGGKSTGYSISSTGANSWGGKGGSTGYRINTAGGDKASAPYLNESTKKSPFGKMKKPTSDTGTNEGAKKAAQTRAQGFGEHPLAKGGGFSIHGTEGTQSQPKNKRPDPEPFRGYDRSSRRK